MYFILELKIKTQTVTKNRKKKRPTLDENSGGFERCFGMNAPSDGFCFFSFTAALPFARTVTANMPQWGPAEPGMAWADKAVHSTHQIIFRITWNMRPI